MHLVGALATAEFPVASAARHPLLDTADESDINEKAAMDKWQQPSDGDDKKGVTVSEKRVARLMSEIGIAGASRRRKLRTTRRYPAATISPDLLERDFTAERRDERWVGDITYVPADEEFVFVALREDAQDWRGQIQPGETGWSVS